MNPSLLLNTQKPEHIQVTDKKSILEGKYFYDMSRGRPFEYTPIVGPHRYMCIVRTVRDGPNTHIVWNTYITYAYTKPGADS